MVPDTLEMVIAHARSEMERCAGVGDMSRARFFSAQMGVLIYRRSPETVARMELGRGLA